MQVKKCAEFQLQSTGQQEGRAGPKRLSKGHKLKREGSEKVEMT